jgi:DNA-binding CsgD family transcriptional regulator
LETLAEQQRAALQQSWWVAMSGRFSDWRQVSSEVERRGHLKPERWFSDERLQCKVDAVCTAARFAHLTPESHPVWRVIQRNHVANWMRDFEGFAASHLGSADDRWLAKVGGSGVTLRRGWDELAHAQRSDIRNDPDICPYLAYLTHFENRVIRQCETMAWAAFDLAFPTADLPHWRGPGSGHVLATLEKVGEDWKIAAFSVIDDNFGQTAAPTWQVDRACRVQQANPPALQMVDVDDRVSVASGTLRLSVRGADQALRRAVIEMADMDWGTMEVGHSVPIVYDPGNDLPVSIWWAGRRGGRLYVSCDNADLLRTRLDQASRVLGLSPSQHRLATAIVEGLTLPEAAKLEGVRLSTARTQLQRVFDKVGVRGQPALVRSLLSIAARN